MKHELEIGTLMSGAKFTLPLEIQLRTLAIIAIRGAGKTVAATVMAEELCECGMPWVALDPVGVWYGLRCNPDGGPGGYPVVVLGGQHGDLPIEKHIGARVAEAVLQETVSCVVDLSGQSKNVWRMFVTDFCDRLMELRPAIPRHIFIEEAPEFVPQHPMGEQKRSLAAVDRLIRLGRNNGYGATLISQRFATINKDVLTQCENLLALRSIGKPDRNAAKDWIGEVVQEDGAEQKAEKFLTSLVHLPDGQGWFWSPQWLKRFDQVRIRQRKTYHPGETRKIGQAPKQVQLSDVKDFVERFGTLLSHKEPEKPTERKAKTISVSVPQPEAVERQVEENSRLRAQNADLHRQLGEAKASLQAVRKVMEPEYRAMQKLFQEIDAAAASTSDHGQWDVWLGKFPGKNKEMLRILIERRRVTRQQLALLVGMSHTSGTFGEYVGRLARVGIVKREGEEIVLQEVT